MIIYYTGFEIIYKNIIIINIGLMVLSIFFYIIIKYKKNKIENHYYRELLDIPLPILKYYDLGKISEKSIWITLLDLISKHYYKLTIENNEKYLSYNGKDLLLDDLDELKNFEKCLVKFINVILFENDNKIDLKELKIKIKTNQNLSNFTQKYYNNLNYEIRNSYGFIDKNINYMLSVLLIGAYGIFSLNPQSMLGYILCGLYALLVILLCSILKNLKLNIKWFFSFLFLIYIVVGIMTPFLFTIIMNKDSLLFVLVLFNPLIFLLSIYLLKKKFYNSKQKELIPKIEGLKHFIKDFSIIKDLGLEYINQYDRYYALGVALNIRMEKNPYNFGEYDDESLETYTSIDFLEDITNLFYK